MTSKSLSDDSPIGVIGAGNFGSVVANMLAQNKKVLLYTRNSATLKNIRDKRLNRGYKIHKNIVPTDDLALVANSCEVIFPIVPSLHFRSMMKELSPHLHPYHILIHGTKGFDLSLDRNTRLLGRIQEMLDSKTIKYTLLDVSGDASTKEFVMREAKCKEDDLPVVFVGGVAVGGYNELVDFDVSGRLDTAVYGKRD